MNKTVFLITFAAVFLFVSCGNDPVITPPPPPPTNTLSGVNKWIDEELKDWYYWNNAVKSATPPSNSLAYDEFLDKLLLSLKGAQDNTESPPTIDGGYNSDGSRFLYSYIERTSATTRASQNEALTFGFDIEAFRIEQNSTGDHINFLVSWVQPDSPADEEGFKRGMWITQYQGEEIYMPQYEKFWNQLHFFQGGNTMTLKDSSGTSYTLTAATASASPIIFHDIVETGSGKKVAYLVYNEFKQGDKGTFDAELREIFAQFKADGAQELVLDLRFNPGGAVSSCQLLTSLAANVGPSKIFCKLLYNKDIPVKEHFANPSVASFFDEQDGLKLNKIYVLATDDTASASEMFINSLRGVDIDIVHIGTTTEGKNVGMNLLEHSAGGYSYEMWPITFKILNAKDFCDYAGGLEPDYSKNQYWDIQYVSRNSPVYELGDPRERLLEAALTLIDGGTVTDDVVPARTRTATAPLTKKMHDPRLGGARVYERPGSVSL